MSDWQPGDLALCVREGGSGGVVKGGVYTVEGLCRGTKGICRGMLGLYIVGHRAAASWGAYAAYGFKRIPPHTPDAEDRETIALLNGKPAPVEALTSCLTCSESAHGGFVTGPCNWSGCPLAETYPEALADLKQAEGLDAGSNLHSGELPHV